MRDIDNQDHASGDATALRAAIIILAVLLCIYVTLGIIFRLSCLTDKGTYSYSHVVGSDYIQKQKCLELKDWVQESIDSENSFMFLNAGYYTYYYSIGWFEMSDGEALQDPVMLNRCRALVQEYKRAVDEVIYSNDGSFKDAYTFNDGEGYVDMSEEGARVSP